MVHFQHNSIKIHLKDLHFYQNSKNQVFLFGNTSYQFRILGFKIISLIGVKDTLKAFDDFKNKQKSV